MKKYGITLGLIISSFLCFGQSEEDPFEHHCLFEERSFTVGLGAPYSFPLESFGLNARAYYNLGEHICFGPEFSYFETSHEQIYDFNFIGHYIFETPWVGIYPLLGGNYTVEESPEVSEEAFGVVFGAGMHRNFKKITVFAEYAHVQSELEDDFLTFGLMINFK